MEFSLAAMVAANQDEYHENYPRLRFATGIEAQEAEVRRADLLGKLAEAGVGNACQGTKLHSGPLSPGCATCTAGQWSCLFINGLCNGRCFYCPTSQDSKSEPTTNNLRFANPQDYIDYVSVFGFKGVSISGGEPLMTFDRTLSFVTKLKKRFGSAIHLWMYTNGMLATEEKIGQLAHAGLDEIRFDISADRYNLERLKLAVGRIPCITVEIPAVPEDYQLLSDTLPVLADIGVNHLNLHQLRGTPHNLNNLTARKYLFSHGPRVLVIESELVALELLLKSATGQAPAVNYCSYAYKYRFQARASRMRSAAMLAAPHEDVTEAGFIRRLMVAGSEEKIGEFAGRVREAGGGAAIQNDGPGRLMFSGALWPQMDFSDLTLQVSYFTPQVRENPSYRGSTKKVALNRRRTLVAERIADGSNREISNEERNQFESFFLHKQGVIVEQKGSGFPGSLVDIYEKERLPDGLHLYH